MKEKKKKNKELIQIQYGILDKIQQKLVNYIIHGD